MRIFFSSSKKIRCDFFLFYFQMFFFSNQFSKFQNQKISMRFFFNLIYFLIVFQRTRLELQRTKNVILARGNVSETRNGFFLSKLVFDFGDCDLVQEAQGVPKCFKIKKTPEMGHSSRARQAVKFSRKNIKFEKSQSDFVKQGGGTLRVPPPVSHVSALVL